VPVCCTLTTVGMSVCLSVVLVTSSCLSAVIDVLRVLETTESRLQEEQFSDTTD
jgi:hypothetical protein